MRKSKADRTVSFNSLGSRRGGIFSEFILYSTYIRTVTHSTPCSQRSDFLRSCPKHIEKKTTTIRLSLWLSTHPSQVLFDQCLLLLSALRCHQHVLVYAFNILHVLVNEIILNGESENRVSINETFKSMPEMQSAERPER